MTTTIPGGTITGRIGLTMQAQYAAALGDPVSAGPTDYECQLANGTLPIIGVITMMNVKRGTGTLAGTYPQPNVPGDVTVDARCHFVRQFTSGATAIVPGTVVGLNATNQLIPFTGAANTQSLGIALNSSSAAGTPVDVAVN